MRLSWHIASLTLLVLGALLVALFALQLRGTSHAPLRRSGESDVQEADTLQPRLPAMIHTSSASELPPLKEPPPKPATKSDPASNKVWFRLLDADTNRPIANTPAIFASFHTYDDRTWWQASNSFGKDKTDGDGLFAGTFRDYSRQPRAEAKPGEPPLPDDADLQVPEGELQQCPYPLAQNYEPKTPPTELEPLLLAFAQGKYAEIIDVRLRRMRKVTGTVVNSLGQPVSGAGVFAIPQRGYDNDAFLQEWSYYYMDIPPDDDAWERPGTRTARIIQRHFEDERPTIRAIEGAMIEPRGEDSRPDRFRYTAVSKWATFWTATSDAKGRFEIAELPRGEWVIGAWHPAHGFTTQLVTLNQSDGEVTFALPNDNTATVDLTVEWVGAPHEETLNLQVDAAGPFGDARDGVHAKFTATLKSSGPWQFRIEGLHEGMWRVAGAGREACVSLRGGECKSLTFRTGPIAFGKWVPTVKLGGADLELPDFEFTRLGEYAGPIFDSEGLVTQDGDPYFRFVEGDYEARIAGSPPIRFQIKGGATTETTINIELATISFSVATELASALRNADEDLTLTLEPAESTEPYDGENEPGFITMANAAIEQMDEALNSEGPAYNELAPGRTSTWRIPRGVYIWKLMGRRDSVQGIVDARTQSRVDFSLSNLPGMAVFTWHLGENQTRDICDAAVETDCRQLLDDVSDNAPTEVASWTLAYARQYLWSRDDRRMYLIAPPGRHVVGFACDDTVLRRVVEFPGAVQLSSYEFSTRDPRKVTLEHGSETDDYVDVLALNEDGGYEFRIIKGSGAVELFLYDGHWKLFIERRGFGGHEDERRREWGTMQVVITGEDRTVDIRGASYAAFGTLVIELSGKAPVEGQRDPWWQYVTCVGIQALDIESSGIVATGEIHAFNMGRPSLKPMLIGRSAATPPGRYKIIPWPGAPDSACKIVTVEPGKECVVRFEGR